MWDIIYIVSQQIFLISLTTVSWICFLVSTCYCLDTKLCLTLCDPMNCSPPGSSVHGILQARILEWVAIFSFKGSSWPRNQTHVSCVSCIGRQILYLWAIRKPVSTCRAIYIYIYEIQIWQHGSVKRVWGTIKDERIWLKGNNSFSLYNGRSFATTWTPIKMKCHYSIIEKYIAKCHILLDVKF